MSSFIKLRDVERSIPFTITAACLIGFETLGQRQANGVFQVPIQSTLGYGRTVFSLSIAIVLLLMGLLAPLCSIIIEKYGRPGVLFVTASVCYLTGTLIFSLAYEINNPGLWVAGISIFTGIGLAGTGFPVMLGEVGRLFPGNDPRALSRRALLFGIVPSIAQTGQFVFAPIARSLNASLGWSVTARIFFYQSIIIFPLAFVLRRKAGATSAAATQQRQVAESSVEEKKPVPDNNGDTVKTVVRVPEPPTVGLAIREALGFSPFLLISSAYFVCGWHVGFVGAHISPYLQDQGLSADIAAWSLSAIGLGSAVGTFLAGFLPSRIKWLNTKWLLAYIYFMRGALLLLFLLIPINATFTMIFSTLFGIHWLSTVPPTTSLLAKYLGTKWLGTISGMAFAAHQVGSFLGVYLGALEYDTTKSYAICWWISFGLALFAGTCVTFSHQTSLREKISSEETYAKLAENSEQDA
ncbi:MFS general substrate transporter [Gonapodya prolifera JEL478]|uniref:MFS general substrate transporter n=1 Tax=Gonapodya prolifera (strain JEL478) TaxID=1344416 RepID=A0A139AM57_GONPJ|nr:MFS general substrate transporter [Gonapodya prolifera JEL478]|eukprot:KXS17644.1 MFS general substrate transporter [Gonapodya prolifera JEL478]